eukprot:tig00021591_g22794.t1
MEGREYACSYRPVEPGEARAATGEGANEEDGRVDVSLRHPGTESRIRVPTQSVYCYHPDCFDFNLHLETCLTGGSWMCPVRDCRARAEIEDLIIDEFFLSILDGTSDEHKAVEIGRDGKWKPV